MNLRSEAEVRAAPPTLTTTFGLLAPIQGAGRPRAPLWLLLPGAECVVDQIGFELVLAQGGLLAG